MPRTPNLPLALALGGLAGITLALNALRWTTDREVSLPFAALAVVLLVLLAVLPWTTARQPAEAGSRPCHKCGAATPPGGPSFCLICGAFPRAPRPTA